MSGGKETQGMGAEVAVEKRVDIAPDWAPFSYRVTESSRNLDPDPGWFGWSVTAGLVLLAVTGVVLTALIGWVHLLALVGVTGLVAQSVAVRCGSVWGVLLALVILSIMGIGLIVT